MAFDDSEDKQSKKANRFEGLVSSLESAMSFQTSILERIAVSVDKNSTDAEELERLRKEQQGKKDKGNGNNGGGESLIGHSLLSGVTAGLASMMPHSLIGSIAHITRMVAGGLFAITIAPAIANFVSGALGAAFDSVLSSDLMQNLGLSEETKNSVVNAIRESTANNLPAAIAAAMVGGRKLALFTAVAGYALDAVQYFFDKESFTLMGTEFNLDSPAMQLALGGLLTAIAPVALKALGSVIIPFLSGPVGLAAVAVVGAIAIGKAVNNWLEKRRDEITKEADTLMKDGIKNLENERKRTVLERWGFTSDEGVQGTQALAKIDNQLQDIQLKQANGGVIDPYSGIEMPAEGPIDMNNLDEKDKKLVDTLKDSMAEQISDFNNLSGLREEQLNYLKGIAEKLGLDGSQVQKALDIIATENENPYAIDDPTVKKIAEEDALARQTLFDANGNPIIGDNANNERRLRLQHKKMLTSGKMDGQGMTEEPKSPVAPTMVAPSATDELKEYLGSQATQPGPVVAPTTINTGGNYVGGTSVVNNTTIINGRNPQESLFNRAFYGH